MASTERIDELITDKALASFDLLKSKVELTTESFEQLVAKAVALNKTLGGVSAFKDVIDNAAKLEAVEKELIETVIKLNTAQAAANGAKAAQVKSSQEATKAVKEETDALSANIKTQLEYQQRIKQINNEIKETQKSYKDGKISLDDYKNKTIALSKEQAQLKSTLTNVSSTIRAQIKDEQTAAGSVEQLRAKLLLLQKAYDNLGKGQRTSVIGKEIKGQLNDVNNELSKLEQGTGRFQRNVGNYTSAFAGIQSALGPIAVALVGLGSIKELFTDIIGEAEQAEQSAARFQNTLKNMGKSDSIARLNSEAVRLAQSFGYLDNDDIVDVFQKLTLYGKLTENQIKQLTPVIIDFAAQQRVSLTEATDVFTKALEGSGKALKTYGIDIKDGANVTERLGILMTDLKGKVDGAAVSFGTTLAGQVAISKQSLKDLEEEIGTTLLPIWDKLKIAALTGLKGIIEGLQQTAFNVKTLFRSVFDSDALKEDIAKAGILQQINQANAYAVSYISSLKDKSTAGLSKELEINKQILQTSKDYAAQAAKEGTATKDQNKLRLQQVLNNQAIVSGLETEIKLSKEKIKVADEEKGSNTLKNFSVKNDDSVAKYYIELEKQISKGVENELSVRLTMRQRAYSEEYNLLLAASDKEKQIEQDKLSTALSGKGSQNDKINAQREYNSNIESINNKFQAEELLQQLEFEKDYDEIIATARVKRLADDKAFNQQFIDAQLAAQQAKIAVADSSNQKTQVAAAEARDILLAALAKERQEAENDGYKLTEDEELYFTNRRLKIESDYLQSSLAANIDYILQLIQIRKAGHEDTSKLESDLAALRLRLAEQTEKKVIDSNKKQADSYQILINKLTQVKDISDKALGIVSSALDARATARKNQLQEESDALSANTKKEIDSVNNSVDSVEKKAARIAIINARAAEQQKQIDIKQRNADLEKARFDKAKGIFDIILNTAISITKALKDNIALVPVYAALGAAELAVAIATPIPAFEYGTKDAPGGLSLVGDGGRSELVQNPDGSMWVTPSVPTVMNIEKHAVVYPDAVAEMERGIAGGAVQEFRENTRQANADGKMDELIRTIRNKTEWNVTVKKDGWEKIKRGPGGSTRYL